MSVFEPVIGLEVHIQLNTKSKMFCGCNNDAAEARPNTLVCPVCFGLPGTLPVINREAVIKTLLLGKALGSVLSRRWNFERKNYFYPDLPKGYQITSTSSPPVIGGQVNYPSSVRINHIHLEEDAGKLIHRDDGYSLVDLNRAGTPLIELVTEPDIHSAEQAKAFLQEVQLIARTIGISAADMEKGHLRCDANISLHLPKTSLGKKVEIKNLNSFNMVGRALEYEIDRQREILRAGGQIVQETRGWDDKYNRTVGQRGKEDAHDYRYLPEPDLPPLVDFLTSDEFVLNLPELPDQKRKRYHQFQITDSQIDELVNDDSLFHLAEKIISNTQNIDQQLIWRLIFADVKRVMAEDNLSADMIMPVADQLSKVMIALNNKQITHQLFKTSLSSLLLKKVTADQVIENGQKANQLDISELVASVIKEHPAVIEQWKTGNQKVFGFLVGQVMSKAKGQADPQQVTKLLNDMLK